MRIMGILFVVLSLAGCASGEKAGNSETYAVASHLPSPADRVVDGFVYCMEDARSGVLGAFGIAEVFPITCERRLESDYPIRVLGQAVKLEGRRVYPQSGYVIVDGKPSLADLGIRGAIDRFAPENADIAVRLQEGTLWVPITETFDYPVPAYGIQVSANVLPKRTVAVIGVSAFTKNGVDYTMILWRIGSGLEEAPTKRAVAEMILQVHRPSRVAVALR